jgi:hypothetical protein
MHAIPRWQRQYLGTSTLPPRMSQVEIEAFFTFSTEERAQFRSRCKATHRGGHSTGVFENEGASAGDTPSDSARTSEVRRRSIERPAPDHCLSTSDLPAANDALPTSTVGQ